MKNLIKGSFIMLGIIALSLTACDKDNDDTTVAGPDPSSTSANDNAMAEAYFDDAYRQMDEQASANGSISGRMGGKTDNYTTSGAGCVDSVKLTTTAGVFPMTLTIYFNGSVTCTDGRKRSGRLICTFSGRYRDANSIITITTDNYYVDGNKVEGTKTVTNNGFNAAGNLNYTISVTNGKITTATGSVITWESTRNREWTAGQNTLLNVSDDQYQITGSASGTNRNGDGFTATITSALLVKMNCKFITQGTVVFASERGGFTLDYGNGVCDDKATLTVNGSAHIITLK
jgi:hypothetical protein